jgi:hypothetical protein
MQSKGCSYVKAKQRQQVIQHEQLLLLLLRLEYDRSSSACSSRAAAGSPNNERVGRSGHKVDKECKVR